VVFIGKLSSIHYLTPKYPLRLLMNNKKKQRILTILSILSLTILFFGAPKSVKAQAGTPSEMLQEINNLRVANGLPALAVNNYLMMSAQNHADWIAETGQGGHVGVDGSDATARAQAVGYTSGLVTENWARGPGLTVNNCIYVSWNDAAHMDNMLNPARKEFGAGVALDAQGFTVYVVNFSNANTGAPALPTITPGGPTVTTAPIIQPVTTATPGPDGSVVHIVQYGQTLWAISDAYGVPLADILALNGFTEETAIYPDEQVWIVKGTGETVTPTLTPGTTEEELEVTPTSTPTEQVEATFTVITPTPSEEPQSQGNFLTNIFSGDTLWVGIGLVAVSVFGIALLLFTSSRLR